MPSLPTACLAHVSPRRVFALTRYLDDGEFQTKFGMSLSEFDKLAAWKKKKMKQEHKLF